MKILNVVACIFWLATAFAARSQGFVNLDFNSANIPKNATEGTFVPITSAIPGWSGSIGGNPQTNILYDDLATGSPEIAILDKNNPFGIGIPGYNYTVVLQAGFSETASISQTALIPLSALSILFTASLPLTNLTAGWEVTVGGQDIPVTPISTVDSDTAVYAGNISTFAGQVDELEFTALTGSGAEVNMFLAGISFSSSPIPEPGEFALAALGASLLGLRRRRPSFK